VAKYGHMWEEKQSYMESNFSYYKKLLKGLEVLHQNQETRYLLLQSRAAVSFFSSAIFSPKCFSIKQFTEKYRLTEVICICISKTLHKNFSFHNIIYLVSLLDWFIRDYSLKNINKIRKEPRICVCTVCVEDWVHGWGVYVCELPQYCPDSGVG